MIQYINVSRWFNQGESPIIALDNINLEIGDKEFVAITGESGSGKSTLLHLLGGLDKPDQGEILVGGWSVVKATEAELTEYRRKRLGIIFQFFNLLPTLNVIENVGLPLQLQRIDRRYSEQRALELLELVGLRERAQHWVHQLSGGEMQRVAIARALVHEPVLVLADEPTGNLDSRNADRILEVFQRVAEQRLTTLIVVTHSSEVAAAAQRTVRVSNGRVADPLSPSLN